MSTTATITFCVPAYLKKFVSFWDSEINPSYQRLWLQVKEGYMEQMTAWAYLQPNLVDLWVDEDTNEMVMLLASTWQGMTEWN